MTRTSKNTELNYYKNGYVKKTFNPNNSKYDIEIKNEINELNEQKSKIVKKINKLKKEKQKLNNKKIELFKN